MSGATEKANGGDVADRIIDEIWTMSRAELANVGTNPQAMRLLASRVNRRSTRTTKSGETQ